MRLCAGNYGQILAGQIIIKWSITFNLWIEGRELGRIEAINYSLENIVF